MVAGGDLPGLHRQQLDVPARVPHRGARFFEFHLLDPVGGEEGDLAALQFGRHGLTPFVF